MNEYQRQAYLSVLGVENYMPKWRLALMPEPVACILPLCEHLDSPPEGVAFNSEGIVHQQDIEVQNTQIEFSQQQSSPLIVADVLRNLVEDKRSTPPVIAYTSSIPEKTAKTIQPFALSIWRPKPGLLIIDSRNAQLALPTELLLGNMLRALLGPSISLGREEILRWPLVENSAMSRTEEDARNALQVWLEVEVERRPVNHLLLFGKNAAQLFLSQDQNYGEKLWQSLNDPNTPFQKIVVPSLVELLQQPLLKRNLWNSLISLRAAP